eukprot:341122_1
MPKRDSLKFSKTCPSLCHDMKHSDAQTSEQEMSFDDKLDDNSDVIVTDDTQFVDDKLDDNSDVIATDNIEIEFKNDNSLTKQLSEETKSQNEIRSDVIESVSHEKQAKLLLHNETYDAPEIKSMKLQIPEIFVHVKDASEQCLQF